MGMSHHPTDGLFTLRCSERPTENSNTLLPEGAASTGSTSTAAAAGAIIDLHPSDAVGNLLSRPEIDEPDAPPLYSVQLINDSGSLDLLDPLSASVLTSTTSLAANKLRQITLHNPTQTVEVKNKSLISYSWVFDWEGSRYVWNRSRDTISTRDSGYTCKLDRKPDPDVDVVRFKPVKKGNLIQILDYNLDRFAYEDRKGLELVLLSSLFAILQGDKLDEHTKPSTDQAVNASLAGSANGTSIPSGPGNLKRQDSDEVETVSPNEILISPHLADNAYVGHCLNLLSDPNLIFLSLTATSAETVPRAIVIASETKRLLLKQANDDISQYIDYPGRRPSTGAGAGATAAIKENGASGGRGAMGGNGFTDKAPPRQIKIYLSRIPLEEFVPKPQRHNSAGAGDNGALSDKERMAQHFASQEGSRQGRNGGAGSAPTPLLPGSLEQGSGNGRSHPGPGTRSNGGGPSERRHNSGPAAPSPSLPTGRPSPGPASVSPPPLPGRSRLQKVSDGRGGYNPPLPPKNTAYFPRTQSQHDEGSGKKKSFWARVSERVCD